MSKISPSHILLPVSLVTVILFVSFGFQASQILEERETLRQVINRQDKPLEEAKKIQAQFGALAMGTKKLAMSGNKNAAVIVDRLKQAGVGFTDSQSTPSHDGTPTDPVPVHP